VITRHLAVVAVLAAVGPASAATDAEDPSLAPPPPAARTPPTELPEPPELSDSPTRRSAVYLVMGLGSPVGFMGFEGVRRLGSLIELSVGLGRGFGALAGQKDPSPTRDVQWAIMPRLRQGGRRHAITFGAGVSGGNYGSGGEWFCDGPCPDRDYPLNYVVWANLEVGSEHWWRSGFALRTFLGFARGCSMTSCTTSPSGGSLAIPYFGLGLGYAF